MIEVIFNQVNVIRAVLAIFVFGLIFAVLFFNKNSDESPKRLFKAMLIGVGAYIIIISLNFGLNLLSGLYPFQDIGAFMLSIFKEIFLAIILVGCFLVGFLRFIYKSSKFNQFFDTIIYMMVILIGFLLFYNFGIFIIMPFAIDYVAALLINNATLIATVLIMSCYLVRYCFVKTPADEISPLFKTVLLVIVMQVFTRVFLTNQAYLYGTSSWLFYGLGGILLLTLIVLTVYAFKQVMIISELNNEFTKGRANSKILKENNLISKKAYMASKEDFECEKTLCKNLKKAAIITLIGFLIVLGVFLLKVRLDSSSTHLMIGSSRVPKISVVERDVNVLSHDRQVGNPEYTVRYVYEHYNAEDIVNRYIFLLADQYDFYFVNTEQDDVNYKLVRTHGLNGLVVIKIKVEGETITTNYLRASQRSSTMHVRGRQ